ncbi:MAG: DnaJ domain-containing protein [Candidatus Hodarchaeales archaeon]
MLGLKGNISISLLKSRFRTLAKEYHPDINPAKDAEEHFKKIINAYEVILKSLNLQSSNTKDEMRNELNFHVSRKERYISINDDPFEVLYQDYWEPKIANMLKNMKKTKSS